jgi:uncharacterized membrane protein HdeD (DUF308 family)
LRRSAGIPAWLLLVPPVVEIAAGVLLFASGSVRDVAVIIGAVMVIEGVTEVLLAIEAKRQGGHDTTPLVASS